MKLTRINRIRDHRVFRDFTWPSELHAFAQFNIIYGWNGCGKTTLSSLLSYAEKRTALSEGELELEFDGSLRVAGAALGSKPLPQIRVFNRDFVNATLQSVGSGIAPIYFLGEGSVEKQGQVDKLKHELDTAESALTEAANDKQAADAKLNEFCKDKAKLIKELLTTANSPSYNNYDKRRFKQAAVAFTSESASAALLTDTEKARLRSQKDAQPKGALEKVDEPSVDLDALMSDTDALVNRSVVAQTIVELTEDADLAAWVQRGLALHTGEHASTTCRFCLQSLAPDRRSALDAHFNDALARFQGELRALLAKLTAAREQIASLRLPDPARFYDRACQRF